MFIQLKAKVGSLFTVSKNRTIRLMRLLISPQLFTGGISSNSRENEAVKHQQTRRRFVCYQVNLTWPRVAASVQTGSLLRRRVIVTREMMHPGTRDAASASAELWQQEELTASLPATMVPFPLPLYT